MVCIKLYDRRGDSSTTWLELLLFPEVRAPSGGLDLKPPKRSYFLQITLRQYLAWPTTKVFKWKLVKLYLKVSGDAISREEKRYIYCGTAIVLNRKKNFVLDSLEHGSEMWLQLENSINGVKGTSNSCIVNFREGKQVRWFSFARRYLTFSSFYTTLVIYISF